MNSGQFFRRVGAALFALCALLVFFGGVLYDLQVVNGADYAAQSVRKIANNETVEAARGAILDRYGRTLVSNRVSWQIALDTALMGAARNEIILALLDICRAQEVTWVDTLPLTPNAPFTLTIETGPESARNRFTSLANKMKKWKYEDESALMQSLRTEFAIGDDVSDTDARALSGVLYEILLRTKEVVWSRYVFADDVDIRLISAVKEAGLVGVKVETATVRQYHTAYAAHILGRVTLMDKDDWAVYQPLGYAMNDTVGKDGAERAFESWLRGERGVRSIETNTAGKVVNETWVSAPQPGYNVSLTLDLPLQQRVEQAMADHIPTLPEAQGGACSVIDVNSGAILALTSYPTYDLANFSSIYNELLENDLKPMYNRATQGTYSPGSTYKMVTAIGALEEGIITPSTRILDTGRYTYYNDNQPMCWIYRTYGSTHGWETVSTAIRDSCNVFFFDTGRRLGIAKLEEYARKFGLGQATGIELPEKKGVIAGPEYTQSLGQVWYEGSILSAAIGQENNQFTPLQLANYTATLANGGIHYSAHLLKSVSSNDFSALVHTREPEVLDTIEIDPVNLAAVKEGMLAMTTTGSAASYFRDLDVKVGAKSGSAQVSAESESNAVFVCFAPYENPQIAIAIVVEKGGSGSELGAIAADICSFYFSAASTHEAVTGENTLIR